MKHNGSLLPSTGQNGTDQYKGACWKGISLYPHVSQLLVSS